MQTTTIQKKVINETFKNKDFQKAVAEAIGDNLVKAIREIDDWNLQYEIKNIMKEAIFTEEFKKEITEYAKSFISDNKDEIKELTKKSVSALLVNGITSFAEKTAELMTNKINDITKVY